MVTLSVFDLGLRVGVPYSPTDQATLTGEKEVHLLLRLYASPAAPPVTSKTRIDTLGQKHWSTTWESRSWFYSQTQFRSQAIKIRGALDEKNHPDTRCWLILGLEPEEIVCTDAELPHVRALRLPLDYNRTSPAGRTYSRLNARPCSEHTPGQDTTSLWRRAVPTSSQVERRTALRLTTAQSAFASLSEYHEDLNNPGSTNKHSVPSDHQNMTKGPSKF